MIDAATRQAYLARLGLEPEPPSAGALQRIMRAQVAIVPYETVWIHLGERWTTDPLAAAERVAHRRRGGYCYHLNGALSELLAALGYDVSRHIGGVHGPDGPNAEAMTNHLVLHVDGLPSTDNPEGRWYVDAGLGDGPTQALPRRPGIYADDGFTYTLSKATGVGDWQFGHDPKRGSFAGMAWHEAPATMDAFAARHEHLSTSPESGFVRTLTVQRRHAGGATILRGCVLTHVGDDDVPARTVERRADWFSLLADEFGLTLDGVDGDRRVALWERVRAAHQAHLAAAEVGDDA